MSAELLMDVQTYDAIVSLCASAAINASDALLVGSGGALRSRADHHEAVTALRRLVGEDAARQLQAVLRVKNKAQYEPRRCNAADASMALKRASRLVNLAKGTN